MTPKPLLIFDFDGTLADTLVLFIDAYNEVAPRYGLQVVTAESRPGLQKKSAREVIKQLKVPFWKLPLLVHSLKNIMLRERDNIRLFPGVSEMLQTLHKHGVAMGILSSNRVSTIRSVMDRCGLTDCFTFIRSEGNVFGKDRYLRYLRRRHPGHQLYYVGDQVSDVRASQRAKVPVIAVPWGFNTRESLQKAAPDYLVSTPQELAAILIPANK